MTLPEIGEVWEYRQSKQLLRVLVIGVRKDNGGDGARIRTITITCEGFGESRDEWWFSTVEGTRQAWTRLA